MPTFEIKVPNDDEGQSLGDFCAEAIPRKGEHFCIVAHPVVCKTESDVFIGIVDFVQYDAFCKAWNAHDTGVWSTNVVVWIREEAQAPVLYCTCSPSECVAMEKGEGGSLDEEGSCVDCGLVVRNREGRKTRVE